MALGSVTKICKTVILFSNTRKEMTFLFYDVSYFTDTISAADAGQKEHISHPSSLPH